MLSHPFKSDTTFFLLCLKNKIMYFGNGLGSKFGSSYFNESSINQLLFSINLNIFRITINSTIDLGFDLNSFRIGSKIISYRKFINDDIFIMTK